MTLIWSTSTAVRESAERVRNGGYARQADRTRVTEREAAASPWQAELVYDRASRGGPEASHDRFEHAVATYLIAANEYGTLWRTTYARCG